MRVLRVLFTKTPIGLSKLSITMIPDKTDATEHYLLAEYHEAANAYFKGVDIGFTTVKSYITINGLFAALIGALSDPKGPLPAAMSEMVKVIPWFALVASFALLMGLPHYFKHLGNCSLRCAEIEAEFGGRLFTKLNGIATGGKKFNTGIGLIIIISSVVFFWLYFALKTHYPSLDIWSTVTNNVRLKLNF